MNDSTDKQGAREASNSASSLPPIEDILMAALFAADRPITRDELLELFDLGDGRIPPDAQELEAALDNLAQRFESLPLELKKLASGYRIEVPSDYARWVSRLWVERPARYSRALLETLALIAYRQPITRPEIESVRGVAVSTHIVRTLDERGWIRVVGHRDVPGKPALYGTTKTFLDYFGLASLDELPTLAEIRDLSEFEPELPLGDELIDEGDSDAQTDDRPVAGEVLSGPWSEPETDNSTDRDDADDADGSENPSTSPEDADKNG